MATRTIDLRPGDARDVAVVDTLMAAAFDPRWGEAWTRNQCLGVLALPGVRLTIAERDDAPVGFALIRTVLDEAELLLLAVVPGMRRAGVGTALMRGVLAEIALLGIVNIHLEVRATNPAIRLYVANGFAQVGVRRGYYRGPGGETNDALTFARAII